MSIPLTAGEEGVGPVDRPVDGGAPVEGEGGGGVLGGEGGERVESAGLEGGIDGQPVVAGRRAVGAEDVGHHERGVKDECAVDAGAEEVNDLGEAFEVVSEPTDLVAVRTALQDAGIDYESAEASFVPSVTVPLDENAAAKVFRLIEALEDSDDVQNVWANFDVSDEVMAKVG